MQDPLGSGVLILDASGGIVQQREFEPFGGVLSQSPPTEANPRLFTGQRLIGTTGLYDFKARWYDPEVGRFLAVDPLLPALGDPQTHNAYSYVNNDPVNLVDPDGREVGIGGFIFLIVLVVLNFTIDDITAAISPSPGGLPAPQSPSGLEQLVPAAARAAEGAGAVAQTAEGTNEGVSRAESAADSPQRAEENPPDDEMVRILDKMAADAIKEEPSPGRLGRHERATEILVDGTVYGPRTGTPSSVDQFSGPRVRAPGHIHTANPESGTATRRNQLPSPEDSRNARNDPHRRWWYVRGTDGRIVRERAGDLSGEPWYIRWFGSRVERVQVRGPVDAPRP